MESVCLPERRRRRTGEHSPGPIGVVCLGLPPNTFLCAPCVAQAWTSPMSQNETLAAPAPTNGALAAIPTTRFRHLRWPIMIGAVAVVALGGLYVYLTGGRYESTD